MKYVKPELVVFENAARVIQGNDKDSSNSESDHEPTLSAYEADE